MRVMTVQSVQDTRIQWLNDLEPRKGRYVFYWMQQSQRAEYNHALEYAIQLANALDQAVLVGFALMDDYPEANLRHYTFMLEGLLETQASLSEQGIRMVIRRGSPVDVASALGRNASLIVCDRGYLRHQKTWRTQLARSASCSVVQVESDVVVPIEVVSQKAEYAARTIRPKIYKHLNDYLMPFKSSAAKKSSLNLKIKGLDPKHAGAVLTSLSIDRSISPVTQFFKGGTSHGKARFDEFIKGRLDRYVENRNQPQTDDISHMSPYLHFGHLSPLYLALQMKGVNKRLLEGQEAYLEELITRRELAMNFVNYTLNYDSYTCIPQWAMKTLTQHKKDQRQYTYSSGQLESAETHDEYWNAAMQEMKMTGFMHNYMRMYWGKKILEWSRTPEQAFRTMLAMNNRYFLDGRDPNSYAGVSWVFGVHDRAWFERPIFGKIRYMAASGLERKCDIRGYVKKVESLAKKA
jgi:deoxyribodipyrimidine photo-lyase